MRQTVSQYGENTRNNLGHCAMNKCIKIFIIHFLLIFIFILFIRLILFAQNV